MEIKRFKVNEYQKKQIISFGTGKIEDEIVLFGAGNVGIIVAQSFIQNKISSVFFYDSDKKKQNKKLVGFTVLNLKELLKLDRNTPIIITNDYLDPTLDFLIENNFNNIFDCVEILEQTIFQKIDWRKIQNENKENFKYLENNFKDSTNLYVHYKRFAGLHINSYSYSQYLNKNKNDKKTFENFSIKNLDIVVTERCSMKCIDCSNLMQYYTDAKNSDYDELIFSLKRLMECVDNIYEFRVIGGEPFVNRELDKILSFMTSSNKLENIIIYTNAQHIPKGNLLEVLKHPKIKLDITNYKLVDRSKNHDKLIEILEENKINYVTHIATTWTDSGRIKFRNRDHDNLVKTFTNCCVNHVLTLLNGKIYRCPFSANAHNLNAIPPASDDEVIISDKNIDISKIKEQLFNLYTRKDKKNYITACNYCGGRDPNTPEIKAAVQTRQPITF
tara:strand:- start:226 stop:1560 length:1335 start_codon:yes stop_codon:yes gene_type:complete